MLGLSVAALAGAQLLQQREEFAPSRTEFADFPMQLADWTGRRETMEQKYIDALKFDDYILANYVRGGSQPVTFIPPITRRNARANRYIRPAPAFRAVVGRSNRWRP